MPNKEEAEVTRLWWKLMQGQASSADIKRYRGLRSRTPMKKGEETIVDEKESRKEIWKDPV